MKLSLKQFIALDHLITEGFEGDGEVIHVMQIMNVSQEVAIDLINEHDQMVNEVTDNINPVLKSINEENELQTEQYVEDRSNYWVNNQ